MLLLTLLISNLKMDYHNPSHRVYEVSIAIYHSHTIFLQNLGNKPKLAY